MRRIKTLVQEAVTLVGPPSERARGISAYPASDKELASLVNYLWGTDPGPSGQHTMPVFQDIDQNNDALISREEVAAFMESRSDGRSKPKRDFENGHPMFENGDTDGDGFLSEAEFDRQLAEMGDRRGRKRSVHRDRGCGLRARALRPGLLRRCREEPDRAAGPAGLRTLTPVPSSAARRLLIPTDQSEHRFAHAMADQEVGFRITVPVITLARWRNFRGSVEVLGSDEGNVLLELLVLRHGRLRPHER